MTKNEKKLKAEVRDENRIKEKERRGSNEWVKIEQTIDTKVHYRTSFSSICSVFSPFSLFDRFIIDAFKQKYFSLIILSRSSFALIHNSINRNQGRK